MHPALVVVDIQREYITDGRRFRIAGIEPSLRNAARLLEHARAHDWPIVHVKHVQDGDLFGRGAATTDFVDGFQPRPGEAVAEKGNFSAYSSAAFRDFVAAHPAHEFVLMGYGTTMCCLSTIVDGHHRGQKFALVADACAARAAADLTEASMHQHAVAMLAPFARISETARELRREAPAQAA